MRPSAPPILLVLLAIAAAGCTQADDSGGAEDHTASLLPDGCPGHWHSGLAVFVRGESLTFDPADDPTYSDAGAGPARGFHVHDASALLHVHPATPTCIPLRDILAKLDVVPTADALDVHAPHDQEGTYPVADGEAWQLWVQPWGGSWTLVDADALDRQMPNASRVLLTYGDPSEADLAAQQDAVPTIPPQYQPA